MRKLLWAILFVVMLLTSLPVYAQSPNYDVGLAWRRHVLPYQARTG